jgi:hypothetical protein
VRVLSLEHSDGWSLVRLSQTGEIGLMPRSYYSVRTLLLAFLDVDGV